MGVEQHHAIIVQGYDGRVDQAHKMAQKIFPHVSSILKTVYNGYQSFYIPPDGGKAGWDSSIEGDLRRSQFLSACPRGLDVLTIEWGEQGNRVTVNEDS